MSRGIDFIEHLVKEGFITPSVAKSRANPDLGFVINDLYNTGVLSESELVQGLNSWGELGFSVVEASERINTLQTDVAMNHTKLSSAVATPIDIIALNPMNYQMGGTITFLVPINKSAIVNEQFIRSCLKDIYRSNSWLIEIEYVLETVAISHNNNYLKKFVDQALVGKSNMNIRQKVMKIFNDAVQSNTMDIVFLVVDNKVKILRKFMSEFHPYTDVEISVDEIPTLRNTLIANMGKVNAKDSEAEPNIGFKIENIVGDGKHEGRVDYMAIKYGYEFHVRIVNLRYNNMTYDNYYMLPSTKEALLNALTHSSGLILVTGARGHGKQVFTYTTINEYKKLRPYAFIETLEDPVEAKLTGNIAQIEIDEANGYDFIYYLKGLKRHSSTLYFIGELRDSKTTEAAINEAVSGALAITTAHAPDCAGVPKKLDVELRDSPDLLIKVLNEIRMMVNLTMTKTLCPKCAIEVTDRSQLSKRERQFLNSWNYNGRVYKSNPKGCDYCISFNADKTTQLKSDGNLIKPLVIIETLEVNNETLDILIQDVDVNTKEREIRRYMIDKCKYKSQEALRLMNNKLVSLDEIMKYFTPNIY